MTTTTQEQVGVAGGNAALSITTKDQFDRLIQVDEQLDASSTLATTHYVFTPDNNVSAVIDPEGVTTNLVHDLDGHRIQIARGAQIWNYTYDKNGNIATEQVPGASGPLDLAYTTSAPTGEI